MPSVTYDSLGFDTNEILVRESAIETTYRLCDARWGVRPHTDPQVVDALDWLEERIIDDERPLRFERTEYDLRIAGRRRTASGGMRSPVLKGPTGEKGNDSIESVYAIAAWAPLAPELGQRARESFLYRYPAPLNARSGARDGSFCCPACTIVYERTLKLVDPDLYREQEARFLALLRSSRENQTRWRRYPFYSTLLVLLDIGTPAALDEVRQVAQHVKPSLNSRYGGDDRPSRLRREVLGKAVALL